MAEKIIKIAENNVEYTESYTVTDVNGVKFEVWGETETYGQDRIDGELVNAQKRLTSANAFNEIAHKKKLRDNAQAGIDKLSAIQAEMDK